MQTVTLKQNTAAKQDKIFDLLYYSLWAEVKHDIKVLYQQIKHTLSEDEQNDLLIDIYNNTLCDDDITTYWNYMNN